jgi:Putative phage abortive infection protein
MLNKKKADTENNDNGFIVISIIVTIMIIGLWVINLLAFNGKTEIDRGTFGDMFGAVNSLFSGLALAGIILTILLQRKELQLQRQELGDTRQEFKTQNETLKLQRFENTFFNLLTLHHQIVSSIDHRYYSDKKKGIGKREPIMSKAAEEKEAIVINGRDVFRFRYNQLYSDLKKHNNLNFEVIYMHHYELSQTDFGHYFRNLYRMIKLVDQTDFFYDISKVSSEEIFELKYRYTSIIRAQISDYELLWIFYNCLTQNGVEKFKPYIENYSLLKNIPKKYIPFETHLELYDKKAFS